MGIVKKLKVQYMMNGSEKLINMVPARIWRACPTQRLKISKQVAEMMGKKRNVSLDFLGSGQCEIRTRTSLLGHLFWESEVVLSGLVEWICARDVEKRQEDRGTRFAVQLVRCAANQEAQAYSGQHGMGSRCVGNDWLSHNGAKSFKKKSQVQVMEAEERAGVERGRVCV